MHLHNAFQTPIWFTIKERVYVCIYVMWENEAMKSENYQKLFCISLNLE